MEDTVPEMSQQDDRVLFAPPDYSALSEMGYLFADMHFHTNCSDSFTDANDAVALARMRGTGVAITDHNLIASAMRVADRKDVFVVPGIEVSTSDGPHILIYFYEAKDLSLFWRKHIRDKIQSCPWLALRDMPTEKLLSIIEQEDLQCLVSAAHPMGYFGTNKGVEVCIEKGYLGEDVVGMLDAYEVICSGMTHSSNLRSLAAAERYGLSYTGGTDGHMLEEVGNVVTAVRAYTREDFLDGIKAGRSLVIGQEKTAFKKAKMGSESFIRFMEHAPSAFYVQTKYGVNSMRRSGSKFIGRFRNQGPRRRVRPLSYPVSRRTVSAR